MKIQRYILLMAAPALLVACEQRVESPAAAPERTVERETIVTPGAETREGDTTIINQPPAERSVERTETDTTIIAPQAPSATRTETQESTTVAPGGMTREETTTETTE